MKSRREWEWQGTFAVSSFKGQRVFWCRLLFKYVPGWVRKQTSERCVSWLQFADGFRQGLLRPQSMRHHTVHCHEVEGAYTVFRVTPKYSKVIISFKRRRGRYLKCSGWSVPLLDPWLMTNQAVHPSPPSLSQLYYLPHFPATHPCWSPSIGLKSERLTWIQTMPLSRCTARSTTLRPSFCFLYHVNNVERIKQ